MANGKQIWRRGAEVLICNGDEFKRRATMYTRPVLFTGREIALAVGAAFMAEQWPLRTPVALALVAESTQSAFADVGDHINRSFHQLLRAEGMPNPTSKWDDDYIRRRASLSIEIELNAEQARVLRLALLASHAEFGESAAAWVDFRVAAPGSSEAFGAVPDDLLALAARFEE